jgi:hypothetical protein
MHAVQASPSRPTLYLRKIRAKAGISKRGRSRRYAVPPAGARTITALLTLRDEVIVVEDLEGGKKPTWVRRLARRRDVDLRGQVERPVWLTPAQSPRQAAARLYSRRTPPSRSRRSTRPIGSGITSPGPQGRRCSIPWCGRA